MNDSSFVFVFLFMIFVAGGIGIAVAMVKRAEMRRRFEQLARRFQGTLDDSGWFDSPSIRFTYQGFPVRIRQTSSGSREREEVHRVSHPLARSGIPLPDSTSTCAGLCRQVLGVQDIEIGCPQFDGRYVVGGNDAAQIRSFLTPAVQMQINQLYFLLGNSHIFLAVQGGQLEIKKLGRVYDYHSLEQFTTLCLELLLDAQTAEMKGIEFVAPATVKLSADVMCQICGDAIRTSDVVFCRSCRTPHHEDCWNYFGACSTFGCGQKVFKRPRKQGKNPSLQE